MIVRIPGTINHDMKRVSQAMRRRHPLGRYVLIDRLEGKRYICRIGLFQSSSVVECVSDALAEGVIGEGLRVIHDGVEA